MTSLLPHQRHLDDDEFLNKQCPQNLELIWHAKVSSSIYPTPLIADINSSVYHSDGNLDVVVPSFVRYLEVLDGDKLPGSLEHLGENMLAFLLHTASSFKLSKMEAIEKSDVDTAIYFDILSSTIRAVAVYTRPFLSADHKPQFCVRVSEWLEGLASKALDLDNKASFKLQWCSKNKKDDQHKHDIVSFEKRNITTAERGSKQISLKWETPPQTPQTVLILTKPNSTSVKILCAEIVR
ncbi:hypothetical protein L2E82_46158 [Cichorium intybus]|uniref:Uncharacterized protein n=1 Tax=Cichorium intybus TaxID=13427 RepID=A0ACB8YTT0_CICIN|nr:hypothetical protein L2E82_46158 [Cichorium intybus]